MRTKRDEQNLRRLLKTAKAFVVEKQKHLADLEAARASAADALDDLRRSVRHEERSSPIADAAAVVALGGFQAGTTEKKQALAATASTLDIEIESVRKLLCDALSEQRKFEHLLEIAERASGRKAAAAQNERMIDAIVRTAS
ncbi:MAG: hypothetical protein AAGJ87_16615 [Pseudomonadota bacterium]